MCKHSNVLSRPVLMVRGLDGFFDLPLLVCAFRRAGGRPAVQFSSSGEGRAAVAPGGAVGAVRAAKCLVSQHFGGDSEGATPLPIPNRAVKPLSADGTWASRPWESRSPPFLDSQGRPRGRPGRSGAVPAGGSGTLPDPPSPTRLVPGRRLAHGDHLLDCAADVHATSCNLDARDRADRVVRRCRHRAPPGLSRGEGPKQASGRLVRGARGRRRLRPRAGARLGPRLAPGRDGGGRPKRAREPTGGLDLRRPPPGPGGRPAWPGRGSCPLRRHRRVRQGGTRDPRAQRRPTGRPRASSSCRPSAHRR